MSFRPFNRRRSYRDGVIVNAPSTGVDDDGAQDLTPGAPSEILACSVQESRPGTTYMAGMGGAAPEGQAMYELRAETDLGVTQEGQIVTHVRNWKGDLAIPVVMFTTGRAKPPHGNGTHEFKISATSDS